MTVQELKKLIQSRDYRFEVSSTHAGRVYGKQTLESIEPLHGTFERYLSLISSSEKTNQLGIQLYQKNGSSHIRRDFFLVETKPVVEPSTKAVDTSTNTVEAPTKTVEAPVQKKPTMQEVTKSDLENVQLKTELKFLSQQNDALKESNKKLEQRNDALYTENTKLQRELFTEKDRLGLEFQKKELELEKGSKQGLAGFWDGVNSAPPQVWDILNGLLNKNQSSESKQLPSSSIRKHSDADTQSCIDMMVDLLVDQKPEIVGMLSALTDYFTKYHDHLGLTFNKFFPNTNTEKQP